MYLPNLSAHAQKFAISMKQDLKKSKLTAREEDLLLEDLLLEDLLIEDLLIEDLLIEDLLIDNLLTEDLLIEDLSNRRPLTVDPDCQPSCSIINF